MMLSAHFALAELTVSQIAARNGIDNTPNEAQTENLRRLAQTLEQVRAVLGKPVTVNSAFRSIAINSAIGGVPTSEHCDGRAADIICPAYGTPYQVAKAIESANIDFNQLIYEGSWVHISIPKYGSAPKNIIMTAKFSGGKATYRNGLHA